VHLLHEVVAARVEGGVAGEQQQGGVEVSESSTR
jgi:hypothetical protein